MSPSPPQQTQTLAERLGGAVVSTNTDVAVSRHVFRDGPSYIVRDPVSFATHQLDPQEYAVIAAIDEERTLGDTFAALVEHGTLEQDDEEPFYEFILDAHRRGLLGLPINDAEQLYERAERKRKMAAKARAAGVLFLRVPLVNPDAFLNRTVAFFRWMFTTPALVAWAVLMLAAGGVAVTRFDDLTSPLLTMVSGANLIYLWIALVGLKVVHEFGHAYACKAFGGNVPEMGAFFILFTPCAYVDATDSWNFPKVRQRAVVTLGGLYFESIVGALAIFVWAATGPSVLNTIAYQVVLLSTVITLGFNLNPLMRYDAYYLVSDLSGVPNLRARAQGVVKRIAKRACFGLTDTGPGEDSAGRAAGLAAFGTAQMLYRVTILISIAAILAWKLGTVGAIIAALMIGLTIFKMLLGLARYVKLSEELNGRRLRAAAVLVLVAVTTTTAFATLPVPQAVVTTGITDAEHTVSATAPTDGFIDRIDISAGDTVRVGESLGVIRNDELHTELAAARAERTLALTRLRQSSPAGPTEGAHFQSDVDALDTRIRYLEQQSARLDMRTPITGRVIRVSSASPGAYVKAGDSIATVTSGRAQAVFLLTETQLDGLTLRPGDTVPLVDTTSPGRTIDATVALIEQTGATTVRHPDLSAARGGPIAIDPATGNAAEPVFEIRVDLPPEHAPPHGAMVKAKLPASPTTLAAATHRRLAAFLSSLNEAGASP